MKIKIKPMSVNQAWQGRRFKTPKYKAWREQASFMMPSTVNIPDGRMILSVIFGVSSKLSDVDNLLKPFIDALQDKYGFNDRQIYAVSAVKKEVSKGKEFIDFEMQDYICGSCWLDGLDNSPICKCEV